MVLPKEIDEIISHRKCFVNFVRIKRIYCKEKENDFLYILLIGSINVYIFKKEIKSFAYNNICSLYLNVKTFLLNVKTNVKTFKI